MPPIAIDITAASRGPSVCVSVTLVHPAKVAGRNEMPFDRDTRSTFYTSDARFPVAEATASELFTSIEL